MPSPAIRIVDTEIQLDSELGSRPSLTKAAETGEFGALRGRSAAMLKVYRHIQLVAPTRSTVLLTGETGTGKEVVARTIHDLSDRADETFVAINCGAISATLAESELFGHERGSFTGANRQHDGVFAQADRGTLFLDEVSEMPIDLQVKLLRVLETRVFRRIGGEQTVQTGARIVAATNRIPEQAVREGRLREDLYYRLRVFPINLPSLRDRGSDVLLLANYFLGLQNQQVGADKRFSRAALDRLQTHAWPGNVRDLQHFVEHAFILADQELDADLLPLTEWPREGTQTIEVPVGSSIAAAVQQLVTATMERFHCNKHMVAKVLGISLKTLYSRLGVYEAGKALRA